MAKYGLQRGIEGSKARHVTTQEFYRNAIARQQNLQDNIGELLRIEEEKRKAVEHATKQEQAVREELHQTTAALNAVKGELKTVRLKNSAAEVGTTILDGIGLMIGTSKVKRQEQEITQLQQEVAARDKTIEVLQTKIQTLQADHLQDIEIQKQRAEKLQNWLKRINDLFPYVHGSLQWESFCRTIGFSEEWIKALFTMKPYRSGELQSIEYNHTFKATDAILQFKSNKDSLGGMQLTINGKNAGEWFRQQQIEFYRQIGLNIGHTKIGKGQNI